MFPHIGWGVMPVLVQRPRFGTSHTVWLNPAAWLRLAVGARFAYQTRNPGSWWVATKSGAFSAYE